jgi:hypothetical protein
MTATRHWLRVVEVVARRQPRVLELTDAKRLGSGVVILTDGPSRRNP